MNPEGGGRAEQQGCHSVRYGSWKHTCCCL